LHYGFYYSVVVLGRLVVAGWAGQLGVLAPWGCDCSCSPQAS